MDGLLAVLPPCPNCKSGVLLPLSDYGPDGASLLYKAWACSSSSCGHTIRADKGVVAYERVRTRVVPDQGTLPHHQVRRMTR